MRKLLLSLALWLAFAQAAVAQVTGPPFTFTNGTVADATEVNSNFSTIYSNALNRTGGTMTGTLNSRSVIPTAANTYDLGSASFPFQSLYLRTSTVLVQSTANYTLTWANPASARAISIADPGGTDVFTFNAATQTLTNKTLTAPVLGGTITGTYTLGGSGTWGGNVIASTVGGTGQTSWTTGDLLYSSSGNTLSKLGIGSSLQVLSVVGGVPAWRGANITLLHEGAGTATDVGATNVDTYALASSLTIKDTLAIVVRIANTGSAANITVSLYNNTDAVTVLTLPDANNNYYVYDLRVAAQTATKVISIGYGFDPVTALRSTFATNWTGAWTLALRHGGITAPDTLQWEWAIYKIAGQ